MKSLVASFLLPAALIGGLLMGVGLESAVADDAPQAQPKKFPQGPPFGQGRGMGRGRGMDEHFEEDHEVFFYLLEHREKIRREVTKTDTGVSTLTESDDPDVAAKIQEHVWAMHRRIEKTQPIHMRDPIFRALFSRTKQITMKVEDTEKGVRVVETSEDPFVASLIKAHADVVSLFIKNGFPELHKNHAVPGATPAPQK
jgi:hypothetical protein